MSKLLIAVFAVSWIAAARTAAAEIRELPTPAAAGSGQPSLFAADDGRVFLSWIERQGDGRHALRFSVWRGESWSAARLVAEGRHWFVNWADFPSVIATPDGTLVAHWLVKSGPASYAYDVHVASSIDGGKTWSAPLVPHRDGTETEHGFVSLVPAPDGSLAAAWLDGRETAPEGSAPAKSGAMTLRYAHFSPAGKLSREALLDARVCDCCQTSAAVTAEGPVVVYRDRSASEQRDISIVRLREGRWSEPRAVFDDGWQIQGCPVNGPSVAADGRRLAVAWFTAANDVPRVKLAFSQDAGGSFQEPVVVDDGSPLGRVRTVLLEDGSALVSWVEGGAAGSSLRLRRVGAGGEKGPAITVVPAAAAMSNGFPQMARARGALVFAWTAGGTVRTAVMSQP